MELDPIVLLAYVSVSLNLITIVAAVVTYAVFWLRRRKKLQAPRPQGVAQLAQLRAAPHVFLQAYVPRATAQAHLPESLGSRQHA